MQILLIGAGAREDALAWKIQNSSLFDQGQGKLYTWPKAYSLIKGTQKLDLAANARLEQLADKALELKIDLINKIYRVAGHQCLRSLCLTGD